MEKGKQQWEKTKYFPSWLVLSVPFFTRRKLWKGSFKANSIFNRIGWPVSWEKREKKKKSIEALSQKMTTSHRNSSGMPAMGSPGLQWLQACPQLPWRRQCPGQPPGRHWWDASGWGLHMSPWQWGHLSKSSSPLSLTWAPAASRTPLPGPTPPLPHPTPPQGVREKCGLGVTWEEFGYCDTQFPINTWNPSPLFCLFTAHLKEFLCFMSAHGWHNVTFRINEASEARRMSLD